jgi:hypothetical protein
LRKVHLSNTAWVLKETITAPPCPANVYEETAWFCVNVDSRTIRPLGLFVWYIAPPHPPYTVFRVNVQFQIKLSNWLDEYQTAPPLVIESENMLSVPGVPATFSKKTEFEIAIFWFNANMPPPLSVARLPLKTQRFTVKLLFSRTTG